MSAAENKQLLQTIFAELSVGNGKPFIDSLADDFCWTITGTTACQRPTAASSRSGRELLRPLFAQFADQYTNKLHRIIAEGDFVVVECRGHVTTKLESRTTIPIVGSAALRRVSLKN